MKELPVLQTVEQYARHLDHLLLVKTDIGVGLVDLGGDVVRAAA